MLQHHDRHHTDDTISSLPRFTTTDLMSEASLSGLPEEVHNRLEDYLDQVMAPLTGLLPFARRQEMRREIRQHIGAMIAAYQEMGETPKVACDKAFQQFGKPEEVSESLKRSSIASTPWQRVRSWCGKPRLSIAGVLPVLLLLGGLYLGGSRLMAPPTATQKPIQKTASVATSPIYRLAGDRIFVMSGSRIPFNHAAFIQHPCTDCHRDNMSTPVAKPMFNISTSKDHSINITIDPNVKISPAR